MSYNIRYLQGVDKFKTNPNQEINVDFVLESQNKELIEYDRTAIVNLDDRFNKERQESTKFRLSGKITNIFNNNILGFSNYTPFTNNLFYDNPIESLTQTNQWTGFPSKDEFVFLRKKGIEGHKTLKPYNSDKYNWNIYVTYPYKNNYEKTLRYTFEGLNVSFNFKVSDGIPYVITDEELNGRNIKVFNCGYKHNLNDNDFIELKFNINNRDIIQIDGLIDDKKFFIYDIGYEQINLLQGSYNTLKRVIDIDNIEETKSKYYVRVHKVLSTQEDYNINLLGFENNPFFNEKKLFYDVLTPNNKQRIELKNDNKINSFIIKKDIDIENLFDNTNRPITKLYISFVNRSEFGFFNRPFNTNSSDTSIEFGYGFNILENNIDEWWDRNRIENKENNIPFNSYTSNGVNFFYNEFLEEGDELLGDICEYNYYEFKEEVLDDIYHKYSYNNSVFNTGSSSIKANGILYKTHYPYTIKDYSDYIETAKTGEVYNIPEYSYFSSKDNNWRWRDIYEYGFIDTDNIGVDYPFLNGKHSIFYDIKFLQKPLLVKPLPTNIINEIIQDDCE